MCIHKYVILMKLCTGLIQVFAIWARLLALYAKSIKLLEEYTFTL